MQRSLHPTLSSCVLVALAMGLFGCPLLTPKDDKRDAQAQPSPSGTSSVALSAATTAAPIASAAPSAKPSAPEASNAADVSRFPDEKKIDGETAKLQWSGSKVRKKPQGDIVATLPKGVEVKKLAERQGFFLVTFADPKAPSSTLMGWVYKDAFTGGDSAGGGAIEAPVGPGDSCPAGMVLRDTPATGKSCNRACKSNAQCGSKDFICYGGACISAHGE